MGKRVNFNLINKYPKIKKWLLGRLGYYFNDMYSFSDNQLKKASNKSTCVVIVAKCHYNESWQSFSSINKKDLMKVVQLKQSTELKTERIIQTFSNLNIDGFDVKTTTFEQGLHHKLGIKTILIPETELFNVSSGATQVFQVETLAGILFSGGHGIKTMSSYAKGILTDIEMYKLSAGLSQNAQVTVIEQKNFSTFLVSQLLKQRIDYLTKKILFKPKSWVNIEKLHMLYLAPLLTALCFYLLSNGYLFTQSMSIEEKLTQGGEQINILLKQKQKYDQKSAMLNVLSIEFNNERLVHNYWNIIYQLIENGMIITRISYDKNQLSIRGNADKASDVLSDIAKNKQVKSAVFDGSVRKYNGRDDFILKISPKEI